MTTTTTTRRLLATAAALPFVPVAAQGATLPTFEPVGDPDWAAVRERVAHAGEVLDIPRSEVRALLALS